MTCELEFQLLDWLDLQPDHFGDRGVRKAVVCLGNNTILIQRCRRLRRQVCFGHRIKMPDRDAIPSTPPGAVIRSHKRWALRHPW